MLNFVSNFLKKERICYEFTKLFVLHHLYWPIGSWFEWIRI
jgi:hypothetical protein